MDIMIETKNVYHISITEYERNRLIKEMDELFNHRIFPEIFPLILKELRKKLN